MAALMPHTCEYPALPAHILTCLQNQRQTGQMCDVTIKVGGRSFPAHKGVLAACSGYFQTLLAEREVNSVELRLVTEKGLSVLLDYMYTAELHLTAGDAQEVMLAAVYLQVTDIMEDCTAYLGRTFQQSQPAGQRSTVSMATMPQHGRQDDNDRESSVSEGGESQGWSNHTEQSREQGGSRMSTVTSGETVNHAFGSQAGNRLDGGSSSANHMAGGQANVNDGSSNSANRTADVKASVAHRMKGVHGGRSSSTNHRSGGQADEESRLEEMHDGSTSAPAILDTVVEVNKTACMQSSLNNSKGVLSSTTVLVKVEPPEDDENPPLDAQDNSIVEHHSDSEFPDCNFGSESFSAVNSTEQSRPSVARINTIASTLFEQQQGIYKDGPNSQHEDRALNQSENQEMQTSFPSFTTGTYGPLNSLQGLFPMPSDPSAAVDLWPVTSDTRSATGDTSFYNRFQNKPFACVKCGAAFKYSSSLRAHKIYKHTSARPFICSICGYSFKDKGMLKRHFRVHKKWAQPCASVGSTATKEKASHAASSVSGSEVHNNSYVTREADQTSMDKSAIDAVLDESSGNNNVSAELDQSSFDIAKAPIIWTTEGGALQQAVQQRESTESCNMQNVDEITPPSVEVPGTAARQTVGSETIGQVNMFSTMLPRMTSTLSTSVGQSNVEDTYVSSRSDDLGGNAPRSHLWSTLTSQAALQGQVVGNTAVNSNNANPSMSFPSSLPPQLTPSLQNPLTMATQAAATPQKAYCCKQCSAVFKYDSSLRAHKLYKHSNARPFVCQDCGYAFKAKGMLVRHRKRQHPKPEGQSHNS